MTPLQQSILDAAKTYWSSDEPMNLCISNEISDEEFDDALDALVIEYGDIIDALREMQRQGKRGLNNANL